MSDSMKDIYLPMIILFFLYENEKTQPLTALSNAIDKSTVPGVVKNKSKLQALINNIKIKKELPTLDIAQLMTNFVSYDTSISKKQLQTLVNEKNMLKGKKPIEMGILMLKFGLICISTINCMENSSLKTIQNYLKDLSPAKKDDNFKKAMIGFVGSFLVALTVPKLSQTQITKFNDYIEESKTKNGKDLTNLLIEMTTDQQKILNSYLPEGKILGGLFKKKHKWLRVFMGVFVVLFIFVIGAALLMLQ